MTQNDAVVQTPPKGRLWLGGAVFLLGQLAPLLIPLVIQSSLSDGWKTGLSGFLALGVPELFILLAIAILGKEGFAYLKGKIFGFLKRFAPPDEVSPGRHRIGLILFIIPLLMAWLLPYFSDLLGPYIENRWSLFIGGDVILIISVFVLGGDFWDKLRGLFIRRAKIHFPTPQTQVS